MTLHALPSQKPYSPPTLRDRPLWGRSRHPGSTRTTASSPNETYPSPQQTTNSAPRSHILPSHTPTASTHRTTSQRPTPQQTRNKPAKASSTGPLPAARAASLQLLYPWHLFLSPPLPPPPQQWLLNHGFSATASQLQPGPIWGRPPPGMGSPVWGLILRPALRVGLPDSRSLTAPVPAM